MTIDLENYKTIIYKTFEQNTISYKVGHLIELIIFSLLTNLTKLNPGETR